MRINGSLTKEEIREVIQAQSTLLIRRCTDQEERMIVGEGLCVDYLSCDESIE